MFRSANLRQQALDDELVPLSVAATVAYFHFTDPRTQARPADSLVRAVGLAAQSLSQVAVILTRGAHEVARPMSEEEVQRVLFRPMLNHARRPDLDRFFIRRGDLRVALVSLREARSDGRRERHAVALEKSLDHGQPQRDSGRLREHVVAVGAEGRL